MATAHTHRNQSQYLALRKSLPQHERGHSAEHGRSVAHEGNTCVDGRLLPELFLLGMPKTATTTLARLLRDAGVTSNHEPFKELKFFDDYIWEYGELTKPLSGLARTNYVHIHPLCPTRRRVIADYTPEHLMMTPLPRKYWNQYSTLLATYASFDFYYGFPGKANLPMVLRDLYGRAPSQRLKFVVTMREPLAQLQSAFYFQCCLERVRFGSEPLHINAQQLTAELERFVSRKLMVPEVTSLMYARHLHGYLRYFQPNQFYLVPFRSIFHQNTTVRQRVADGIFALLGLSPRPAVNVSNMPKLLQMPHPRLEDSIPQGLIREFRRLMLPQNTALVKLLVAVSSRGGRLAAYDGAPGSEADVRTWLTSRW